MKELNKEYCIQKLKKETPIRKEKYNRYSFDFIRRLQELREIEHEIINNFLTRI